MDSFKDIWDLRQPGRRDSSRHKERVRRAMKDNLRDLIAEESIISSHKGKKVKVPMKYLDLWRFKYGNNKSQKGVGHGEGDPGDIVAREGGQGKGPGKPGSSPGEELFEEEVDLDEVIEMMLDDLGLPLLEEKENQVEIETEETRFQDISERGIPANIDKRRTILQNLKRNAIMGKPRIGGFTNGDLRYRVWEQVVEKHSNASVILIMDRSGSMTSEKKYIVKSFFFWMVNFLRRKYNNVELVFVAHDTQAREVPEEGFFTMSDSGGTMISSGLRLARDIIEARFPIQEWNNYVFSFSDGENWGDDNKKCVSLIHELMGMCQAVGYGEVQYSDEFYNWSGWGGTWSTLHGELSKNKSLANSPKFTTAAIVKREDIYTCLRKFLSEEGKKKA